MIKSLFLDIKNKLKDSKGYALLNMVLLFLVLLILIVAVSASALSNQKQSVKSKDHNSIYYYAEGGIHEFVDATRLFINDLTQDDKKLFIDMDVYEVTNYLNSQIMNPISGLGLGESQSKIMNKTATRIIDIRVGSEVENEIIVRSTAHLGDSKRSVEQSLFNVNGGSDEGEAMGMCVTNALTANSKFIFSGEANIYGKVKILNPEKGSVEWRGPLSIKDTKITENDIFKNGLYHPKTSLTMDDIVVTQSYFPREALLNRYQGQGPYMNAYYPNSTKEIMPETAMEAQPDLALSSPVEEWRLGSYSSNGVTGDVFGKLGNLNFKDNMLVDFASGSETLFYASELTFTRINSYYTLYIDVGDKEVHLVLDKINLLHNFIVIQGTGSLKISVLQSDGVQLNPYGLYHEDAIELLDGMNDKTYIEIEDDPIKHETHQRNITQAKNKLTIQLYNPGSGNKTLRMNNVTHQLHEKNNKAFVAYTLIADKYNVTFESISQRPKQTMLGSKLIRTSQFNVILYGDNVELSFPSTISEGEGLTLADIYFVPKGKINFAASGFSGAMIADVIEIANTNASLYFNVDANGILPPDFSIFDYICGEGTPGLPGSGGAQGGMSLGPIKEVRE